MPQERGLRENKTSSLSEACCLPWFNLVLPVYVYLIDLQCAPFMSPWASPSPVGFPLQEDRATGNLSGWISSS